MPWATAQLRFAPSEATKSALRCHRPPALPCAAGATMRRAEGRHAAPSPGREVSPGVAQCASVANGSIAARLWLRGRPAPWGSAAARPPDGHPPPQRPEPACPVFFFTDHRPRSRGETWTSGTTRGASSADESRLRGGRHRRRRPPTRRRPRSDRSALSRRCTRKAKRRI